MSPGVVRPSSSALVPTPGRRPAPAGRVRVEVERVAMGHARLPAGACHACGLEPPTQHRLVTLREPGRLAAWLGTLLSPPAVMATALCGMSLSAANTALFAASMAVFFFVPSMAVGMSASARRWGRRTLRLELSLCGACHGNVAVAEARVRRGRRAMHLGTFMTVMLAPMAMMGQPWAGMVEPGAALTAALASVGYWMMRRAAARRRRFLPRLTAMTRGAATVDLAAGAPARRQGHEVDGGGASGGPRTSREAQSAF